jgi:hypothetical protein
MANTQAAIAIAYMAAATVMTDLSEKGRPRNHFWLTNAITGAGHWRFSDGR